MLRDNPTVMSFVRENALTAEDEYKVVGRAESMIAFAIGDRNSGKPLNDPRILKWYAEFFSILGGEYIKQGTPLHSCTEDELAKFYTPDQASAKQAETMKELGAFQCLDVKAADFMLSGVS